MQKYVSKLSEFDTQNAIALLKDKFSSELCDSLDLSRVSAPLFVKKGSGINDDLNGTERPVEFDIRETGEVAEVVHSLAKWKRMALMRYEFPIHTGLYTDMNAIRRDEICDNIHSLYVDQWDWEKVITAEDRTQDYLKSTVRSIYGAILRTASFIKEKYPAVSPELPERIGFVTTYELEEKYPQLTPKERENAVAKRVFGNIGKLVFRFALRGSQAFVGVHFRIDRQHGSWRQGRIGAQAGKHHIVFRHLGGIIAGKVLNYRL